MACIELATKHVISIFSLQNVLYSSTPPKQDFFFHVGTNQVPRVWEHPGRGLYLKL